MKTLARHLCILGLPMAAGLPATAQEQGAPSPYSFSITGAVLGSSEGDMSNGDNFQWTRSYVEAQGTLNTSRFSSIGLQIGGGQTNYSFGRGYNGRTKLDVDEVNLSVPMRFRVGARRAAIVIPQLNFAAESGADLSDGMTYGVIAGVTWKLSPTLLIGPGFGLQSSLLDETVFFPFLLIDWEFADRWSIATGSGFAATRGPGLRLAFDATSTWEIGIEARYEEFEFRLSDSSGGGTGVDRSVPIVLTSRWSPSEALTLNGFVGVAADGEFVYEDGHGNEITKSDYDPAPIFGLLARYEF